MRVRIANSHWRIFSFAIAIILAISFGCRSSTLENAQALLATPEGMCQASASSWLEISPGESTEENVLDVLGEPATQGHLSKVESRFFLYPPIVDTSETKSGNLVVFRKNGVVDWMDLWVANSDGKFHTVAEFARQYGPKLDRAYVQGINDTFGPGQVYVWSECGLAITAVSDVHIKRFANETLALAEQLEPSIGELTFRYPVHPSATIQPSPNVDQIVVRQFIFQPTSFDSFRRAYADWIPYLSDKRFYRLDPQP